MILLFQNLSEFCEHVAIYTKESLETLRQRIDLIDVVSSHIELKAAGATYKGLCPFHDEKTPSFIVTRGDSYYHCFGCGAHGDAIQFLMGHLNLNFVEAIENLATRFGVRLEKSLEEEEKGPNKRNLKDALQAASRFYHFMLLYSEEGQQALKYLFQRGVDLEFIRRFELGLAPRDPNFCRKVLFAQHFSQEILLQAGLLVQKESGKIRDFFYDRITFPICDGTGAVIGFSARKYREETTGGKYINTAETAVFKKSKVLFGLHFSRKRISKERKAILVEGQLDALRLIDVGLATTVAAQGTAFGEGHVKELIDLGVEQVFIAFDADRAGQQAAAKVGQLFQKEGVAVYIVSMPSGEDPDSFIKKYGPSSFLQLLADSREYLVFLIELLSTQYDIHTPAGKNALVDVVTKQIRTWNNGVMMHESLRRVAQLLQLPEDIIGVGQQWISPLYVKRASNVGVVQVDPDRVLEGDLLRWLFRSGNIRAHFLEMARINLSPEYVRHPPCHKLYREILKRYEKQAPYDLFSLMLEVGDEACQALINEIMEKKVNELKAEDHFVETLQKILDRRWMEHCEEIRMKIASGNCSDDELLKQVKAFDDLKKNPFKVKLIFANS